MSGVGFHHAALFYDDPATVALQVAAAIERDRSDGTATLVCLPDRLARAVADHIPVDDAVTFLSVDHRYSRPVQAMRELWKFTNRALASGARRVHSIGEIGFDGSAADQDWHWYERAANDVLASLPLTATCLVDAGRVSADVVACCRATHSEVIGDGAPVRDPVAQPDVGSFLPRAIAVPDRVGDLVAGDVVSAKSARRAVSEFAISTLAASTLAAGPT